jgi:hypothetical protein
LARLRRGQHSRPLRHLHRRTIPGGRRRDSGRTRAGARGRRRAGFRRRTSSPPSSSVGGGLRRRHASVGDDARARRAIAIAGRSWGEGAATARGRAWARGGVVERGSEDGPPPPPPPPSGEDCAVGTPPSGTTPNDAAILGGLARMQKIRGARLTYRCHRSWGRARGRLFLIFLWLKDF